MDRILELLARAGELTADEQAELAGLLASEIGTADTPAASIGDIDDDRLAEIVAAIPDAFDSARAADDVSLDLLGALADARDALAAEDQVRQDAAEEAQRLVDDLARRVHASDTGDGENDGDDEDGDGDEAEGDETGGTDETAGADASTDEHEAVTASAPTRPTPLGRLNRRRMEQPDPAEMVDPGGFRIYAAPNLPVAGELTVVQLTDAVSDVASRLRGASVSGRTHLARFSIEFPEDRQLSASDARLNEGRVRQVHDSALAARRAGETGTFEALVAAGGLCGPLPVRYDQDVLGTTARPVASALGTFDGSRGGVRYVPGPTLSDIGINGRPGSTNAAIGTWTMADDEAADPDTAGTFKSIQRIDCGEEATAELYLITARFAIGNIQAMTWPERVRAYIDLASVGYARAAEIAALSRIQALSQATAGFGPVLGSARDLLAEWATAAYALRTRNRVEQTYPVRVIAPEAARTSILIDLQRQLPGDDAFGRAQRILDAALAEINVAVTWSPDMQIPGAVGVTLGTVPTEISYSLSLEGTFDLMTGINIDLGFESGTPVRDSRLNAVNDHELFMEGGEQVVKFGGHQALWVTTDVCPTGATGGSIDVVCSGS